MKKLILGLLLIFSFSYGNENRHLTQRADVITLTSSYAHRLFSLNHIETKEILINVLGAYEEEFGSQSLMNVSMCMTNFTTGYYETLDDCKVKADFSGLKYFLKGVNKDYKEIITQVTTALGAAFIEISLNELYEKENEKKNKKRI